VGSLGTLWRGLTRRCGRCGGRPIGRGFFGLRERCPRCGYRFKREEGFFTGVYLVNFAVTVALLWVVVMAYTLWSAVADHHGSLVPILAVGVGIAVVVPVAFYSTAATTWAALDLILRPLEPEEEAEAEAARSAGSTSTP
jgi:uncharacterized protein (DUF983 family)